MRIGIDVDDTITDTWEMIIPYYVSLYGMNANDLIKSNPYYQAIKDKVTVDEYYKTIKPILHKNIPNVPIKKDVSRVINKLHEKGNEIIFITSRSSNDNIEPYQKTVDYLNKHNVYYDKIIIGQDRKDKVCLEEKIDLFIDDSNKHCDQVAAAGIDVLMFETAYNKNNLKHRHVFSWKEIENDILGESNGE